MTLWILKIWKSKGSDLKLTKELLNSMSKKVEKLVHNQTNK